MQQEKQNFLEGDFCPLPRPPKRVGAGVLILTPFKLLPYFILLIFVFIVFFGVFSLISLLPYYNSIQNVYAQANEAQRSLLNAQNMIEQRRFAEAGVELSRAETAFDKAVRYTDIMGEAKIFNIDYAEDQRIVARDIFEIGLGLSGSLKDMSDIGEEIFVILNQGQTSFSEVSVTQKAEILKVIYASVNDFEAVDQEFTVISDKLADINSRHPLFIFDSVVSPLQEKIPELNRGFSGFLSFSRLVPILTGYPEQRTYLLALQNNRELRATGGFLGTVGHLTVENAELVEFDTENVYVYDRPARAFLDVEPPEPIQTFLRQEQWFLRDSNWWPDFPRSAEKMQWFYYEEGGEQNLDGVIAITPDAVERLLRVIGDFQVRDTYFTPDNLWEQLEYEVEQGFVEQGLSDDDRKEIIAELGDQIISRLYSLPLNKWLDLIDLGGDLVKEKHLLLYSNEPKFQTVIIENGWGGEVKQVEGDFVMLVDSNMAAKKTDQFIDRSLHYYLLENENGEIRVEAKAEYVNHASETDWRTTHYGSYSRLYAPQGSELIDMRVGRMKIPVDEVDKYDEFGKTAFGLFFQVFLNQSTEVVWTYKLPADLSEKIRQTGEYDLFVQKQSGLPEMDLSLDLNFWQNGKLDSVKHEQKMVHDEKFKLYLAD